MIRVLMLTSTIGFLAKTGWPVLILLRTFLD